MTHEALEPCPFCGGSARQSIAAAKNGPHNYAVGCSRCIIQTEWTSTEAEAIAAWNTRPPNPLQAEVEALRARVAELEGNNARLREHIAKIANTINIVGSTYDLAIKALESVVTEVKRSSRAALKQEETK